MEKYTLTKQQIIRSIGRQTGLRDVDVTTVIETLINVLYEQIAAGGRIEIQNFLVLEVQTRTRQLPAKARPPNSKVSASTYRYVKVKPSKKLRTALRSNQN